MIPTLVTKDSVVQKVSSRQTVTGISNTCCYLDQEHNNPVFSVGKLAYNDIPSNQVWRQKNHEQARSRWTLLYAITVPPPPPTPPTPLNEALHLNKVSEGAAYLSKLGAQTMARFLECMPVSKAWLATRPRCLIRYSSVLKSHKHSDM